MLAEGRQRKREKAAQVARAAKTSKTAKVGAKETAANIPAVPKPKVLRVRKVSNAVVAEDVKDGANEPGIFNFFSFILSPSTAELQWLPSHDFNWYYDSLSREGDIKILC